jgi:hypothetical protein
VTYEQDVTGYGRKMGRNGGGNGYAMEDPHPFTEVTINQEVKDITGRDYFNYGSYTPGTALGSEAGGGDGNKPRKTGEGLPWNL